VRLEGEIVFDVSVNFNESASFSFVQLQFMLKLLNRFHVQDAAAIL